MMPVFIQRLFRMLAERLAEFSILKASPRRTQRCKNQEPHHKGHEGHTKGLDYGQSLVRDSSRNSVAFRPPIGLQDFLAQAQRMGRDLGELVVSDEFNGLLQIQR